MTKRPSAHGRACDARSHISRHATNVVDVMRTRTTHRVNERPALVRLPQSLRTLDDWESVEALGVREIDGRGARSFGWANLQSDGLPTMALTFAGSPAAWNLA